MALAKKLKHFNLFNDGNVYGGIAKTVTLPKLARKMEAYRGGGMDGPVKVDLGFGDDGIVLAWTLGGWDLLALRQFGAVRADGIALRFCQSAAVDDAAVEVQPLAFALYLLGRHVGQRGVAFGLARGAIFGELAVGFDHDVDGGHFETVVGDAGVDTHGGAQLLAVDRGSRA